MSYNQPTRRSSRLAHRRAYGRLDESLTPHSSNYDPEATPTQSAYGPPLPRINTSTLENVTSRIPSREIDPYHSPSPAPSNWSGSTRLISPTPPPRVDFSSRPSPFLSRMGSTRGSSSPPPIPHPSSRPSSVIPPTPSVTHSSPHVGRALPRPPSPHGPRAQPRSLSTTQPPSHPHQSLSPNPARYPSNPLPYGPSGAASAPVKAETIIPPPHIPNRRSDHSSAIHDPSALPFQTLSIRGVPPNIHPSRYANFVEEFSESPPAHESRSHHDSQFRTASTTPPNPYPPRDPSVPFHRPLGGRAREEGLTASQQEKDEKQRVQSELLGLISCVKGLAESQAATQEQFRSLRSDPDSAKPSNSRPPAAAPPRKFTGQAPTDDLDVFRFQCDLVFKQHRQYEDESQQAIYMINYLDGIAQEAVRTHVGSDPNHTFYHDPKALLRFLDDNFTDPSKKAKMMEKLKNLRQGSRPVAEFFTQFRTIIMSLGMTDWQSIKMFAEEGLNDDLRKALMYAPSRAENLEGLIRDLTEMDQRIRTEKARSERRPRFTNPPQSGSYSAPAPPRPLTPSNPPRPLTPSTSTRKTSESATRQSQSATGASGPDQSTVNYRLRNNLCLKCGDAGHKSASCPSAPAHLRAATEAADDDYSESDGEYPNV